jgi:uncharacterized protein (DUF2126 family)
LFARAGAGPDSANDAAAFIVALARELAVESRFALPAYEDAWHYLLRERRLPVNVDPHESKLDDPIERARLARVFEQGLASIVGYALPLRRAWVDGQRAWESGRWHLRPERLYLLPGDSPMGFRLPLDSLPWAVPGDKEALHPPDPFAPRDPLPPPRERGTPRVRHPLPGTPLDAEPGPPKPFESAPGIVRSALCVEPREGILHVFLPPTETAEEFLDLCACIEATAEQLHKRVRIEGYGPPADPRLGKFSVTPDPGVIEVNIHPAGSWEELAWNTTALYEEARKTELRTEKFMLDGRHCGTGGGNHIVLGGASAGDSPLLRRPDVLRSLIGYWLNHPSLSYLFSGMFVGPTSQAPRVDEARDDSIYEIELAFRELEKAVGAGATPPWLVDRIFRNLLVDVTGNTHRAEFCIDKLYSPDSASGRMGLVELRSFEMPPHEKMSLTQQLLVRALVARFWQQPYRAKQVRWGTELHDRFMLPAFVKLDFDEVLDELGSSGFRFDPRWFAPHHEFRFPLLGAIEAKGGITLELRQAIEPWHVLGEETTGTGTARYVDSSVERVEVKVRGMIDSRHVVACNGRAVPLRPTGTRGEQVAGVRYRAWRPPSALHPTIGIHTPLVFDLIDTWNDRAIAGCTYHAAHPGGRAVDTFPRNSFEAESRRAARFYAFGHSAGRHPAPPSVYNPEFPFTLDLRR